MDPDRWRRATTPLPVLMVIFVLAGAWMSAARDGSSAGVVFTAIATIAGLVYIGWALQRAYGRRD